MCPYLATLQSGEPAEVMEPDLFERIGRQIFGYAYHLALSCAYEPLLHPRFEEILEIAGRFDVPEWGIVTNGLLLTERLAEAMIRNRMRILCLSVDGVNRETYRSIRGVDALDKVLGNARMVQEMKRSRGSSLPHLIMNFVMMRRNVEEVVPFLELCRELGTSDVNLVHITPRSRENPESLVNAPELYEKVYAEAKRFADENSLRVVLPAPFSPQELEAVDRPDRERRLQKTRSDDLRTKGVRTTSLEVEAAGDDVYCVCPWIMVMISPNGDVHPCGHRQSDPPFGNLARQSFESIWNGPAFLDLRRRLYYHDLRGKCLECESVMPNSEPMVRRPIRIFE